MAETDKEKALQEELAQTQASLNKRYEELAELTRMLVAAEHERDGLREQMQAVVQAVEAFRQVEAERSAEATPPAAEAAPETPGQPEFEPIRLEPAERKTLEQYLELVRDSELFDAKWYLETYPDVKESRLGRKPAEHYLYHGGFEGRHPGPNFNSVAYFQHHPDVYENRLNPLVHYLLFGREEGRQAFAV